MIIYVGLIVTPRVSYFAVDKTAGRGIRLAFM